MRSQPLFNALGALGLFLLAINLAFIPWRERLPDRKKIIEIQDASSPNTVLIGSSIVGHHFNQDLVNKGLGAQHSPVKLVDTALGGCEAQEQSLLMQYALHEHPTVDTAIVGMRDFQLTEDRHEHPKDLTGNRTVAVDLPLSLGDVADAYQFSPIDRMEFELLRLIPMFAYRQNVWKNVELLRRSMEQIGMPHKAENGWGRAEDFAALADIPIGTFDKLAQQFAEEPTHFNHSYEDIFHESAQRHMKVIVVLMPLPQEHRARYYARSSWVDYVAKLRKLCVSRGYTVIDASDWLNDSTFFADSIHMSQAGNDAFSYRFGQELSHLGL